MGIRAMLSHSKPLYKVTVAFICVLFARNVLAFDAANCAYIELVESSKYNIKISQVNGELLYSGGNSYSKWNNATKFRVPQGRLEFVGQLAPLLKEEKNIRINQHLQTYPLYFAMDIEPGWMHRLAISEENGVPIDVILQSSVQADCDDNYHLDLTKLIVTPDKSYELTLNDEHSFILQKIFQKIANEDKTGSTIESIVPAGFSSDLGLTFNTLKSTSKHGLEVLSVTPMSPISEFGIISGDVLLKVNDQELTLSPEENRNLFLNALLQLEKELEIILTRHGRKLTIKGRLIGDFVPRYGYTINPNTQSSGLIKYRLLPTTARYQLDRVISLIVQQYKSYYGAANQIVIKVPEKVDAKLGILGVKDEFGIKVNFVSHDGIAQLLGVKVDDYLVALNGISLNQDNTVLNNSLLSGEQKLEATVLRNGKKLKLKEDVILSTLPSFELIIDIESKEEFLAKQEKTYKTYHKIARILEAQSSRVLTSFERSKYVPDKGAQESRSFYNNSETKTVTVTSQPNRVNGGDK